MKVQRMEGDDIMKRFFQLTLWSALCMTVLLSGCRSGPDGPVRVRVTREDIQVTFTSAQYIYDSSDMDPEAPLDFEVRIDYLGQEKEVQIYYGTELGYVWLYNNEGADILEDENITFPSVGIIGTLRPGEPFVELFTGETAYALLEGIPVGSYTAKTHVSFDVVQEGTSEADPEEVKESIEMELELPIQIR